MDKLWLSYDKQVSLLARRGLGIADTRKAKDFLSRVSYYRLSGYFRYWQRDPAHGDDTFLEGASFETIQALYEAERSLATVCDDMLHPIEVLLRTRFAYHYASRVGAHGTFATGKGFTQPSDPRAERVEERLLADLDRSKEAFVTHYRSDIKTSHRYAPDAYKNMPIWVAVEALSFGTLSRLIEASGESQVLDDMAESMNVSRRYLPSQVRSFVYLRNRIAHCAKLWNHSVLDVPGISPKTTRRTKKNHHDFTDHSVYKILVALDDTATRSGTSTGWLSGTVSPILEENPLLAAGITAPTKYGGMHPDLLT